MGERKSGSLCMHELLHGTWGTIMNTITALPSVLEDGSVTYNEKKTSKQRINYLGEQLGYPVA